MDSEKLEKHLVEAEPIFGFNVIGRLENEELDTTINSNMIHTHQQICYMRLFGILTNTGANLVQQWTVPAPVSVLELYQNNAPVLSHALLDRFETWFDELPQNDAKFFAEIFLLELKRLCIIANEKYASGLSIRPDVNFELAKKHFRFHANGNLLQIKQAEVNSVSPSDVQLYQQHKMHETKMLISRIRDNIAALDIRINEVKDELSLATIGEESISSFLEDEAQLLVAETLEEQKKNSITHIINTGENLQNKLSASVESFVKRREEEIKQLDELHQNIKMDIDTKLGEVEKKANTRIESVASGIVTNKALESAFTLWDDKKIRHWWAFYIGVGLFIALILIVGVSAYKHFDPILEFLSKIFASSNGSIADIVSRVVLITIPIGIAIWVLRALLRWANLNLALAEDAAQRSVMAQTYVNLLTSGDVTEDKDDRKVMLEAIFRPLPGIQEMDTAPPSIINFSNPNTTKKSS